jgi:hypothetical protein
MSSVDEIYCSVETNHANIDIILTHRFFLLQLTSSNQDWKDADLPEEHHAVRQLESLLENLLESLLLPKLLVSYHDHFRQHTMH